MAINVPIEMIPRVAVAIQNTGFRSITSSVGLVEGKRSFRTFVFYAQIITSGCHFSNSEKAGSILKQSRIRDRISATHANRWTRKGREIRRPSLGEDLPDQAADLFSISARTAYPPAIYYSNAERPFKVTVYQ